MRKPNTSRRVTVIAAAAQRLHLLATTDSLPTLQEPKVEVNGPWAAGTSASKCGGSQGVGTTIAEEVSGPALPGPHGLTRNDEGSPLYTTSPDLITGRTAARRTVRL
jgi:hypothetical protein